MRSAALRGSSETRRLTIESRLFTVWTIAQRPLLRYDDPSKKHRSPIERKSGMTLDNQFIYTPHGSRKTNVIEKP
jgi:hypothetical protein